MLSLTRAVGAITRHPASFSGALLARILNTSPSTGLTNLNGTEPWNSTAEGFTWVRATPTNLSATSGDMHLMDLDDGDSDPSAGLRIRQGDNDAQGQRYRDEDGNVVSGNLDGGRVIQGALRTFGFTWSDTAGKVRLVGAGTTKEYSFTPGNNFLNPGFARLYIGSRNGSNDLFVGTISAYEVGNKFLSTAALAERMKHGNMLTIIGAGQSLSNGHWEGQQAGGDNGYTAFVTTGSSLYGKEIITVDGATGSSALSNNNTGDSNYWYNEDTGLYGSAYETFLTQARAVNAEPDWVFWAQGEQDSFSVNKSGEMTKAEYKALMLQIFERMRSDLNPNLKVGIQGIGRRSDGFSDSNIGGIQAIREAQQELADEISWVHMLGYSYHVALTDARHLTDAGYGTVAQALIRRAAAIDGQSVTGSTIGPQITGASRSDTTVTVTLSHDAGTDFTPSSGIVGFRFFDNGVAISITAAVRTDATTITLTLNSTPSGVETLYYCWDDADDITNANLTNVVTDNSAQTLPLVPVKITL